MGSFVVRQRRCAWRTSGTRSYRYAAMRDAMGVWIMFVKSLYVISRAVIGRVLLSSPCLWGFLLISVMRPSLNDSGKIPVSAITWNTQLIACQPHLGSTRSASMVTPDAPPAVWRRKSRALDSHFSGVNIFASIESLTHSGSIPLAGSGPKLVFQKFVPCIHKCIKKHTDKSRSWKKQSLVLPANLLQVGIPFFWFSVTGRNGHTPTGLGAQ